jgi:glutaredoxin 3
MPKIEIYSGDYCPFCQRAKGLLTQRGYVYTEYNVQLDSTKREEMMIRSVGARTIPQVFINGRHVGGYDALYALDRKGELADWLARV